MTVTTTTTKRPAKSDARHDQFDRRLLAYALSGGALPVVGVPAATFRAVMNIGSDSASSEILRSMDRRMFLGGSLSLVGALAGASLTPKANGAEPAKGGSVPGSSTKTLYDEIRTRLLERQDIAFLDVREEIPHAEGHPLFAASFPLSTIELRAYTFLPQTNVPIILIDNGEGFAEKAQLTFKSLGYTNVRVYEGGIKAWAASGGQLFKDINVPSKAFGELMYEHKHTPMMPPEEVDKLKKKGDVVVLDVRRPDEYSAFSIPGAVSVPGAEVVEYYPRLVPNDKVQVIVNCAGRTRGQIWAQALINAGVKNPVASLENGTIGWTLAGLPLSAGQQSQGFDTKSPNLFQPAEAALDLANRAKVKRATFADCLAWQKDPEKTTYFFDVRSHAEYINGHVPGWRNAPSGEIVQELMMYAPVRGARIVLYSGDGVRANMSASWLSQMNCDVWVLDQPPAFTEKGEWESKLPAVGNVNYISEAELVSQQANDIVVIDVSPFHEYKRGHIPGAWYAIRSDMPNAVKNLPKSKQYVITDRNGTFAPYIASELEALVNVPVSVLKGGTQAWAATGGKLEKQPEKLASPAIDRFHRPYEAPEGDEDVTFNESKIKEYIGWLSGTNLLQQLAEDGTSGFWIL